MKVKWIKAKVWQPLDVACLKWSCILFGMILGAYLADFTRRFLWVLVIAGGLLAVKPVISYFRDDD